MDLFIEYSSILLPLLIIQFILLAVALIDLIRIEATKGPKLVWLFIILFIHILGPIVYFIFGRKEK